MVIIILNLLNITSIEYLFLPKYTSLTHIASQALMALLQTEDFCITKKLLCIFSCVARLVSAFNFQTNVNLGIVILLYASVWPSGVKKSQLLSCLNNVFYSVGHLELSNFLHKISETALKRH